MPETILNPLTTAKAIECVGEALETMAFIVPDPADELPSPPLTDFVVTTISFRAADGNGSLQLYWPAALGQMLEQAVLCDATDASNDRGFEALNELANVSCGLLLRSCQQTVGMAEVGLPATRPVGPAEYPPPEAQWIIADGQPVSVRVTMA